MYVLTGKFKAAPLSLPSVQDAIEWVKPLIGGFGERFGTEHIGGHGLAY